MRSKASKKSAPNMGKATVAFRKLHVNLWPPAVRVRLQLPQHEMGVRSDAMMAGPEAVFFPPKRSKDLDTGCGARRAGRVLS